MDEARDGPSSIDRETTDNSPEMSIGDRLRNLRPDARAPWQRGAAQAHLLGGRVKLPCGDVEIIRRLGGGSMGTVYEATHDGAIVAIKALNNLTPQQLYCLKNEFRTLASVSHPNLVSVYQLFGAEDAWYFTMELIAGVPLTHHWRLRAPTPSAPPTSTAASQYAPARDQFLRELLRQLIEGVVATHHAGLIHRDLKPANVLVEPSGRLVIVDFGLVSDQEAGGVGQTVERVIAGTPAYMAPEQARGQPASAASDWYAVGVMLYELLTGHLPHQGSTSEILSAKQEALPQTPMSLVPSVPADLDDLSQALMLPDPKQRPTSDQMLALCRSWQLSKPSRTREHAADRLERFVGRREVLAQLDVAYRDARNGGPTIVLVEGDSGIGKTALLKHFVTGLQRIDNAFVLQGRCYEQETMPHKAFDGVIDQVTRILLRLPSEQALQLAPRHVYALTRLFPVLLRVPCFHQAADAAKAPADKAQLRRHGYEAMRELLCRIADRRSLVIAIDDLHWGDDDSLRLLCDVLAPPDAARLLLVATYRHDAGGRIAQLLERPNHLDTRRIRLGKLSEGEARSLAAAVLGDGVSHSSPAPQAIAEEADGMPLYVIELARNIKATNACRAHSLTQLLQRNIEQLASEPRSAFELIAAAGRPLSRALLASASELSDLHEPLAVLRKARLVRAIVDESENEYLEAYHHRVREACLSLMTPAALNQCRAKLTKALEEQSRDAEPEWLSELYFSNGERTTAARYAVAAAHQANNALAFHRAAELFARAADYLGPSASAHVLAELYELHARALANVGRSADAALAFSRAAKLSSSREALRLESAANRQWMRCGHLEEAVTGLQNVFAKLGIAWPTHQGEVVTRLMLNRARIRLSGLHFRLTDRADIPPTLIDQLDALYPAQTALGMFDHMRGAYFASLALPLALRAGDARHLVSSLMSESVYSAMLRGSNGHAHSEYVRSKLQSVARFVSEPLARSIVTLSSAMGAYWEGRWERVAPLANSAADGFATELLDGAWEAALARSIRNTVYVHTGELFENRAELAAAARDASARNDQYELLDVKRSLATIALLEDDVEHAAQILFELERALSRTPLSPMHVLMTSSIVALHLYRGEPQLATERLDAGYRKSAQMGFLRFPLVRVMLLGMRADCVANDANASPNGRAATLQKLARSAEKEPIAWAAALGASLRAQADLLRGNTSAARTGLALAIATFERHALRVPAAIERLRAAELRADAEVEREQALNALKAFGFKSPARWGAAIRSLH